MEPLPFDTVVILDGDKKTTFTLVQFFALPLSERVRAIISRRVQFFAADKPVDTNLALRLLRERVLE